MNSSDRKYFIISLLSHAIVILCLTMKVYFFSSERPEFIRAVRVDLVALPDKDPEEGPQGVEKPAAEPKKEEELKTKKEEANQIVPEKLTKSPQIDKKKNIKEPQKAETKESPKSTKDQQSDALKRLQALSNLKKRIKESKEGPEGKEYKGNQLNEGNSLTGVEKIQYDKYLTQFNDHIKRNWQLPEWLSQKNLSASVLVRFDEMGNIIEKRLSRPSGDVAFDREALQAVTISAPFPLPPENLLSRIKARGIEVRFPE